MAITLEQKRAADVWTKTAGCDSNYVNLAKGLPTLIMGSGLMQVLAFLHEKSARNQQHRQLGDHLRNWLKSQFPQQIASEQFTAFMESLFKADPGFYQQVTSEAFAWLRWVRQIAPARNAGGK